ncbi:ROK family transcriptional regulator [Microbacterium sp. AK031]|uniref:ROK family transcriptional regulator n=1 Tax=Microbacterium sp. AK031 TaxID=2723076 RepID=UPI002167FB66|nr:ROK family transcriptional regulator [Microbacterium sp. AK031]MCS3841886.1 putative NBD/HSP70 family sugar kinase [Microbacterium sp. AK031]
MAERASSVERVRAANLGEVLRLVHQLGPRSRAVVTAETGLNRSTVADLVAELASRGLVVEQEPDPTRRVGRPSPIVATGDAVMAIAVNPEVDAIEVGAVALSGRVRERIRVECERPPSVEDVVGVVARVVEGWQAGALAGSRFVGIGVAVPGLVRVEDGLVRLAPHLGWHEADIRSPLTQRLGLSAAIDNDASLGARAERLFGAAREHRNVVYLNGGASGIGGGLILDGTLIAGAGGYAGEWGQTRPSIAVEADRRTRAGTLEDEVNRARLLQVTGLGAVDDPVLAAALSDVESSEVADEIDRQRRILAATLANAVNVLNPSMIVLGGFLGMLSDSNADGFTADVRANALAAPGEQVEIRAAALGADRLLIGAAEAAFAPLLTDPARALDALSA